MASGLPAWLLPLINAGASIGQGFLQNRAIDDATKAQTRAGRQALDVTERADLRSRDLLQPFVDFGTGQIGAAEDILTPQGQFDFLSGNPIFDAALGNANLGTNARAASRGRFGAGDTAGELFNNYLATSFPILQSQTQNLFNAVGIGGNAAARTGNQAIQTGQNVSNLLTGIGNVNAQGAISQANAFNTGLEGVLGALPGILEGFR